MEYNIRLAKFTDCSTLSIIKRKVWETTYRGIYPDEKLDNYDYRKHEEKFIDIREKGVNEFFISCNKYNINGQKFYEKMGGKIINIDEDNIDKSIPQVKFHYDIKTIQDICLTIYNDKEIRNIYNQINYLE